MKLLKRIFMLTLIVSVWWSLAPKVILAQQGLVFAGTASEKGITELVPEFLATPEEEIPGAKEEGKPGTWTIVLGVLGLLAVGGLAAAGMGGGGGGGSSSNGGGSGGGSVSVGW